MQAPMRPATAALWPNVYVQIMVTATLLLKRLTVIYFLQHECKLHSSVVRNFCKYNTETYQVSDNCKLVYYNNTIIIIISHAQSRFGMAIEFVHWIAPAPTTPAKII